MRKGWEYKKLEEICSSDLGKTLNKSKDVGNMRPYLCAINILWDSIDLTTLKEACFKDDEIDRYTVKYGDLLVCEGGDTGRAAIWDRKEPILYQNALHRLRFKEDVDARFIMYNLWHKKQIGEIDHKYSKGVTILHLVKSALLSIPILLPPLSTQLAIVSELDKINELIRLKKEQLKDFDNLAQSLFYEMFGDPVENEKGWKVKKLGDICADITDGDHMPPPKSEFGIPFITISDIDKDTRCLNFENTFYVPEDYYNNLKENRKPQKGDLLYTVTGSYGIPVIVKTDKKFCFQRHIALLRPNKEILSTIFLCYWVLSDGVKFMADKVATGIAQKTVGLNSIRKFSCILPPLPLQRLFAQRIEQIEREKSEVQKSIQDLETLLASRMQYWFE